MKMLCATLAIVAMYATLSDAIIDVNPHANPPDTLYPATPSYIDSGRGDTCYATATPLAVSGSSVFTSVNCLGATSNKADRGTRIVHIDPTRGTKRELLKIQNRGAIFRDQPIMVGPISALVYTRDESNSSVARVDADKDQPAWFVDRRGSLAGIDYAMFQGIVYVPIGGPQSTKNELRAYNVSTGQLMWGHTGQDTWGNIGTPVYYENRVYFLENNTLKSYSAVGGTTSPTFSMTAPCGFTPIPGEQLQMKNIFYGWDTNGPLNALIIYGNTLVDPTNPTGPVQFSLCRVHHAFNFGQAEWTYTHPNKQTIYGLNGGAMGIYFSTQDLVTNQYQVFIFNATGVQGPQKIIPRDPADKYSTPEVMWVANFSLPPYLVFQLNGSVTTINLWDPTLTPAVTWPNHECSRKPTMAPTGDLDRLFCVPFSPNGVAFSFDYEKMVWELPGIQAGFPPQPVSNVAVFIQESQNLLGVSFAASATMPPSPASSGPNAGVVVLVIFIIVFLVILAGAGYRAHTARTSRRTVSRVQLDKEGYAGLNA